VQKLAVISLLLTAPLNGLGAQQVSTLAQQLRVESAADTSGASLLKVIERSIPEEGALFVGSMGDALSAPTRWNGSDYLKIPAAAVGIGVLSLLDEAARDFMQRNQSRAGDDFANTIEPMGTVANYYLLAGFYFTGIIADDARARRVAAEGLASSAIAGALITPVLQKVTGRHRPRAERGAYTFEPFGGHLSFPSGHTTQAFAVASVIASEYDAWWVKVAAYGVASMVGFARMYHDAHHLSDVATAALIGTTVGTGVVHMRRARSAPAPTSAAPAR
jgi:membrane-associated phospholipid phosphatase